MNIEDAKKKLMVVHRNSPLGKEYEHFYTPDSVHKVINDIIDNNMGEALLYAVNKTAERTKREMIKKAAEWLSNNMFHSVNNGVQINGTCVSDFVEKFKQAMQDERDF